MILSVNIKRHRYLTGTGAFFAYFCNEMRNFAEKQEKRIDFPEIFTIIKAVSMIEAQMP